jgi:dipeptidyl aminopeptidase/acylaminoacyl peptidase
MNSRFFLAVWVLIAVVSTTSRAQLPQAGQESTPVARRKLEVDDYFRIKEVSEPQISPEGKWVAYKVTTRVREKDTNEDHLWMVPTTGGDAVPLTSASGCAGHPRWSPDQKYLAFIRYRSCDSETDIDTDSGGHLWLMNRAGGEPEKITHTSQNLSDIAWAPSSDRLVLVLQDSAPEDSEPASVSDRIAEQDDSKPRPWVIDRLHFKEDGIGYLDHRRTHLYVITLADRKITQITSGDYDDYAPAWSPDGRSIAFVSNRSANSDSNYNSGIWVVAADNENRGSGLLPMAPSPFTDAAPSWSPDGKWIAFTRQLDPKLMERATAHLAIAPAAGGEAKLLTQQLDRNVLTPQFSRDGRWIYFLAEDDGAQNLQRVPSNGGEISRPIPGRRKVDSFSMSDDGIVAAAVSNPALPDEIHVLPLRGELRRITTTNDAVLSEIQLGDLEYVHFHSKDGTAVAGYICKPPDYSPGKKYPAVLWLHGGPVLEYFAEFNFRAQLLAANGYLVVQPNPRASSGYGQAFSAATYAGWGGKDIEDDLAAMDFVVAQGLADPDRLGVGGHSYGAISANWIITKTNRFKAAISYAGNLLNTSNFGHDEYSREWATEVGLPWEKRALWESLSPFSGVANIKTPTLAIGGDTDWNCPILNSEQLYQSLKWLGVPTVLVVYPGETHEISRPSFVKDYFERYLFWFAHYIKGEGPAIPSSPTSGPRESRADSATASMHSR